MVAARFIVCTVMDSRTEHIRSDSNGRIHSKVKEINAVDIEQVTTRELSDWLVLLDFTWTQKNNSLQYTWLVEHVILDVFSEL